MYEEAECHQHPALSAWRRSFVIANSAVVSGSPIHLTYVQRVILCSAAVCSIGTAPFIGRSKTRVGMVMKLVAAAALIWCIFAFGGFMNNSMA
ncbi:hypothetical protein [Dysosmobacter sp. Phy]